MIGSVCAYEHSLLRHLHIWLLASVGVNTLVPSMDVHTCLRLGTLVFPRLTLVNVCVEECASFGAGIMQKKKKNLHRGIKKKAVSHPGTAWCPAAGIPLGIHMKTSLVHSRTGIGTGSLSSCTRRCLLSLQLQVSLSTTSSI